MNGTCSFVTEQRGTWSGSTSVTPLISGLRVSPPGQQSGQRARNQRCTSHALTWFGRSKGSQGRWSWELNLYTNTGKEKTSVFSSKIFHSHPGWAAHIFGSDFMLGLSAFAQFGLSWPLLLGEKYLPAAPSKHSSFDAPSELGSVTWCPVLEPPKEERGVRASCVHMRVGGVTAWGLLQAGL